MLPTTADDISSDHAICRAARNETATLATIENSIAAAMSLAVTLRASARNSGASSAEISAEQRIAASGSETGVRKSKACGRRTVAATPAVNATAIASSTVVNVKPKIEPGIGSSKGATAATRITPAATTEDAVSARVVDTRGTGIAATLDNSGRRGARQVPHSTWPPTHRGGRLAH